MDERKNSAAPWIAFILTALLLYPLSMGPACWGSARFGGAKVATIVYKPLTWAAELWGSQSVMNGIQSYSRLGTGGFWAWTFQPAQPGNAKWCSPSFVGVPSGPSPPPP
jgi:hypothetical protein